MSAFDSDEDEYVFTKGETAWSASDLAYQVTHIMPLMDVVLHELDDRCVCGPAVRVVTTVVSGDWEVWKHHSLVA